ncbi:hypothetical protein [Nonomuraea helvata]|uniref:WD40 repeat domain-containing protein n=1 Tax=Nonomuraea helvata TaxID=37484 RepID=A0ABV5SFG8_9ACTN
MNIEELLRETFADMSREEEPPPPSRYLRARPARRRVWRPVAAAAGVAVLVAATTVVIQRAVPNKPDGPVAADMSRPVPVSELWPRATHVLSKQLPNGLAYRPEAFLDEHTLLARTGKGDTVWWSYDVRTGTVKRLVAFVPPPRTDYTSPVVLSTGRLLWYTVSSGKVKGLLDIWTAPVTGGTARKVTSIRQSMKNGDIDLMTVVDDKVVWSRFTEGGIYQAPLSGGAPAPIPGTERFHLLQWPWAGAPKSLAGEPSDPQPTFRRLVNVVTGERRDARTDDGTCSLTWCVNRAAAQAFRRDGSGRHVLTARPVPVGPPILDRFLVLTRDSSPADNRLFLYDLKTRRTGDLFSFKSHMPDKAASDYMEAVTIDHTTRYVLTYNLGDKRVVIDLPAIPG